MLNIFKAVLVAFSAMVVSYMPALHASEDFVIEAKHKHHHHHEYSYVKYVTTGGRPITGYNHTHTHSHTHHHHH